MRAGRLVAGLGAIAYNRAQQHPPRLSTMRTRGVTFCAPVSPRRPIGEFLPKRGTMLTLVTPHGGTQR